MTDALVLVHGAWHSGKEMQPVAARLRSYGYDVYSPTLKGNRDEDDRRSVGLKDAISSLAEYIDKQNFERFRLVAHSYGGMVISGVAHEFQHRINRIVYCNAFVPMPGESVLDLVPEVQRRIFESVASTNDNAVTLPFPVWRDVFMSDADFDFAKASYSDLNAQPFNTLAEGIALDTPLAQLEIPKSYLNCQQDVAMPGSMPWHPRLSERLGLFRLIECAGSHELPLSDPVRWADAIHLAARD